MFYKTDIFSRNQGKSVAFSVSAAVVSPSFNGEKLAAIEHGLALPKPRRPRRLLLPLMLAGIVIFAICIAAFFSLSLWPAPPHAQDIEFASNARLAFSKEYLIPPPPLPPSIFIGVERGSLEAADRDWNKLEPLFRQKLLEVFVRMQARGYTLALVEGYRSPDRQDQLASAEQKLTNARAFHSLHQFGLAADVAPIRNGKLAFDLNDEWTKAAYFVLGEEAAATKLTWGGSWSLQDYGHVQFKKLQ